MSLDGIKGSGGAYDGQRFYKARAALRRLSRVDAQADGDETARETEEQEVDVLIGEPSQEGQDDISFADQKTA